MNNMKGLMIMKSMKKYLSLLLVMILLLTQLPLSALAESALGEEPLTEELALAEEEEADADAEAKQGALRDRARRDERGGEADAEMADAAEDAEREEEFPEEAEADEDFADIYSENAPEDGEVPEELLVGHTTVMKGDFFTEMFGNDTVDIDVRALIHGYNLVNWDQEQGVYVIDPSIVTGVKVGYDGQGNATYYMAISRDLQYSDGSPITAWDYAFSLLLMMSPEIEEIGGKIYRAEHILGYDEYITRQYPTLTGVEVLDDYQLAITLDHDFLPYFFEPGLLLCVPYPIQVIAPGCRVYDDGYGVYIGNIDPEIKEPIYTADLLRETILDPETGYNSHPSVVSGPYTLVSYDDETAHFEINPYYKGSIPKAPGANAKINIDINGIELVQPTIERICFTLADNDTLIDQLVDGELHLVNKMTYAPTIMDGLMRSGEGDLRFSNYPRIGLAFLTFSYDWPTVNEKEVRQAIAWCMDRDALIEDYCQGFGVRVDGYYGIEQWEYLLVNDQLDYPIEAEYRVMHDLPESQDGENEERMMPDDEYEAAYAAWEALNLDNLTQYSVDIERATRLLVRNGWTLNREGDDFRPGIDDVRCKFIDGELIALDLSMMYPAGNHIVDTIQENFIDNLNACGILLTLVPTDMQELFYAYYRETERTTDMIYLATNFHVVVDPSITYSTDTTLNHQIWNNTYSDDDDLYWRAVNMRKTDPGDIFDYVSKWVSFQERYNEVLPTIPIYSNIYFDFFTDMLQNYYITSQVTWSQAILQAYFGLDSVGSDEFGEDDFGEDDFGDEEFEDDGDFEVFDDDF